MAETMTAPTSTSADAAEVDVRIEDDASPLVRLIGRTLRDSARTGHALDTLNRSTGTVAIRSHDTPQAATITFGDNGIDVSSGVLVEPDAAVTVDLNARFAPTADPSGDTDLAGGVLQALTPPLPGWRDAAQRFWDATRSLPGIPDVLIAVTEGPEGLEQAVLGDGPTQYLVAGAPETLAGVFSGADDLVAVLSSGALGIQGTMSQLSVMAGASWKVRYDV
ncbi:hypothetical protein BEK98_26130 [Streptomyces diastatochromogenes]|uniref:Uncharacterized protein n=2 Tax=Streptomyces diastatochromogenes TaxID=42236 RepID=A0A233S9B5_STRDA|nr:hypothetical protein [Streptomyces diastatochromogenes]OXY92275.1 hypothetical protein BEK98_26130 [Streptomyces diastatochromogenes]